MNEAPAPGDAQSGHPKTSEWPPRTYCGLQFDDVLNVSIGRPCLGASRSIHGEALRIRPGVSVESVTIEAASALRLQKLAGKAMRVSCNLAGLNASDPVAAISAASHGCPTLTAVPIESTAVVDPAQKLPAIVRQVKVGRTITAMRCANHLEERSVNRIGTAFHLSIAKLVASRKNRPGKREN